jgi:hypothetical protein
VRVTVLKEALPDVNAAPQAALEVQSAMVSDLAVPSAPAVAHQCVQAEPRSKYFCGIDSDVCVKIGPDSATPEYLRLHTPQIPSHQ